MDALQPMAGVRIVELTTFGFVPSGVAILADWGADVIKVEHPRVPDPMRGLIVSPSPDGGEPVDTLIDHFNRGKRDIALDLADERGLEVFYDLIRSADVMITSFMLPAQRKLRVSYEDLKPLNPQLVFAHGHGFGALGPDAERPGFDGISYWARGGVGHALTFSDGAPAQQRAGFGDVLGGLTIATGVSAALFSRSNTGEGCVVDVSLLGVACWHLAPDIIASGVTGGFEQRPAPTKTTGPYRTSDDRYVVVLLLLPHYLPNVLRALGREDALAGEGIRDFGGGVGAAQEIDDLLRSTIARFTADEIRDRFSGQDIAWSIVQSPYEVLTDPQVLANGYVVDHPTDPSRKLVTPPAQFNRHAPSISGPAPTQGQHTREILAELGRTPDAIDALLGAGVAADGSGGLDSYGRIRRA